MPILLESRISKVNDVDERMITKEPFQRYNEEKKADTFTIRFNHLERKQHDEDKRILNQEKDSTALKQLARIGSVVIHDEKIRKILGIIFINKRRNARLGIVDFE